MSQLTCLEICAGAGGQSLGLEQAGFEHVVAIEIDPDACETLRLNRPDWNVFEKDVHHFQATGYRGSIDLLAGGVPCPPFSIAGKQLGGEDERDLFPQALRLTEECDPAAVMLENVRGLASARFANYREQILSRLRDLGYKADWQVLNASEFGVPQLRPRFILVALKPDIFEYFEWPSPQVAPPSVGETLRDLMAAGRVDRRCQLGPGSQRDRAHPCWGLAQAWWSRPRTHARKGGLAQSRCQWPGACRWTSKRK